MASYDQFAKTEQATPRRREKAREEGDVALSRELSAGITLLVITVALESGGAATGKQLMAFLRDRFLALHVPELSPGSLGSLGWLLLAQLTAVVGGMLALLSLAGVLTTVAQVGFRVTPLPLAPKWSRINPFEGWSRLFSMGAVVRTLLAAIKAVVLVVIMVTVLRGHLEQIRQAGDGSVQSVVTLAWTIGMRLCWSVSIGLVIMGLADFLFQRYQLEQRLMMSRQEIKEEFREQEGDPQVRAKIKRLQREMLKNRMLRSVPTATVVVTNPTHLAVAIHYESGKTPTPKVVAKGAGVLAKRIAVIARRHNVPVLERKPVAQALYKTVEVGQEVPPHLYQAIVEILTFLYRMGKFK